MAVDRGRYTCLVAGRTVTAMKARELGRCSVVVGDRVHMVGDTSGARDTLARIVRVRPRASALRRSADDVDPVERVVVANADQIVVVSALADPQPRRRFIDRCLVAAYDADLNPLLCLTKADLAAPADLVRTYAPLGVPYVITRKDASLDTLRARLADRVSVFVGQSGVGKSTLVNALVPSAGRATGTVNPTTGQGRHVSSSAVAFALRGGGWIIDTPGIRGFGLAHVTVPDLVAAFPELAEGARHCPRDCDHRESDAGMPDRPTRASSTPDRSSPEPTTPDRSDAATPDRIDSGCALDAWVAAGHADPARLDSLRRLLRSRRSE